MTTSKIITSSKDRADREFLRGPAVIASAVITSLVLIGIVNLIGFPEMTANAGGVGLLVSLANNFRAYRKYFKNRTEFIDSVRDAVKRETGYEMSPKSVMQFLFSGKADDGKGNSLRLENDHEELHVLLVRT